MTDLTGKRRKKQFFRVGWLIDGGGGPVQKNRILTVEDGIITANDPWEKGSAENNFAQVIDLSRCTILPPLVDCHVHLVLSGVTGSQVGKQQVAADPRELKLHIAERLHSHLNHGVLAVRDGGDRNGDVLCCRNEGAWPGIVKAAGRPWHQPGRYGLFGGQSPRRGEALDHAFARSGEQGDHVKLINSGLNSLTEFARETDPQFSTEEMARLVLLAESRGQKVMVHANGREPVRRAIEAGCHSIEHGFFMGRENLQQMAKRGTTWVPTVVTMKALLAGVRSGSGVGSETVIAKTLARQLEQLSLAREYGVKVALGTDAGSRGVLHGISAIEELNFLLRACYPLAEALRCASVNGAALLGVDEIGLLTEGRTANFLVVRGGPVTVSQIPSSLEGVFLGGSLW